jgi:hypothetical protein
MAMSRFLWYLDLISENLIPQHQDPVVTDQNFSPVFNKAITSWIKVVNLEPQAISPKAQKLSKILFFLWKPEQKFPVPSFIKDNGIYDYIKTFLGRDRNTDTTIVALIAFGVVAFHYVIALVNKTTQIEVRAENRVSLPPKLSSCSTSLHRSSYDPSRLQKIVTTSTYTGTTTDPYHEESLEKTQYLLLSISGQKESFIETLKLSKRIESGNIGILYESCEYLSILSDKSDPKLIWKQLQDKFKSIEHSEHDIYLVCVALSHVEKGFTKDANQLDRYDAFRELVGSKIEVSSRLRVEIYNDLNFYKR